MMEHDQPRPMTFLILSDLHFGALSVCKEFAPSNDPPPGVMSGAVSMKESLVKVAAKENIDAILVSGDLTSKGSPEEFVGCLSTLNDIAVSLDVCSSRVIYTYGNHDVDWHISRIPAESSTPDIKDLYLKVGASVGDIVLPKFHYKDKGPVPGCGLVEAEGLRIYVVNSGYYCSHDQEYKHGKLGDQHRVWIEQHLGHSLESDKWHVMLLHHHPYNYCYPFEVEDISCLEEGAFLIDLIGKSGVDLVCHGHRHHPILFTEMRTGWVSPVTLLCAGSLAVNEQHRCKGEIPNLFHIVSLEKRLKNRAAVGRVKSFQYSSAVGWQSVCYTPCVPLDAERRFADVYDFKRREDDIKGVIDSCITGSGEQIFELPQYDDLPLSLQCMSFKELNDMLRTNLSRLGMKNIGEFPNSVMVRSYGNARSSQ
ncbi:MAG: metallophosphoesterase [Syntrophaceae bacterium]